MYFRTIHGFRTGLFVAIASALVILPVTGQAQVTRQISSSGTTSLQSTPTQATGVQSLEFDPAIAGDGDSDHLQNSDGSDNTTLTHINRSIAPGHGHGQSVAAHNKSKSNPQQINSFNGLNFFNQRFANSGNQFSVVPPDQALCVGNGYVVESVNDVINVYGPDGTSLLGTEDLNTFYGYPAAINRSTGAYGASITDPTCHFDAATQRFFHVVLTLDRVGTTSALSGSNHLDIAVSNTDNPLGTWTIYKVPVQDDGSAGTPDHNCTFRQRINGVITTVHGPCLGDYPHIGMDANGLYISTNEFSFFGSGFHGAQIYALSKQALAAGAANVNLVQFDTAALSAAPYGVPGFTTWPALSPSTNSFNTDNGGTEFLLSSLAVFTNDGVFNQLVNWNLSNTQSLASTTPAVVLNASLVDVQTYAVPPDSLQKAGDFPLGQCLEDSTCWRNFVGSGGPFTEHETELPSNDSRVQQVSYANGKLWAALDTDVVVGGSDQAGAAYFVLQPQGAPSKMKTSVVKQGVVALQGQNVNYPAIAVTSSGRGAMGFTVVGNDNYPSAGYTSLDAIAGAGDIHIAAEGAGPDDGFSAYPQLTAPSPRRPRWGDYGAAAVDGDTIWLASEYTAQTCNLSQFIATNFTCGGTRGAFGNWATRITHVNTK
jgi:hypothetical protein